MKPTCITKGSKIISMRLLANRIHFLDSLSFLSMPLAALPAAFGLTEDKKVQNVLTHACCVYIQ